LTLAAAATITSAAIAGDLKILNGPAVLTIHSQSTLSTEANEALQRLQQNHFFGALAVSRTGLAFGRADGVNDLKAAKDLALMICRKYGDPSCKIHATLSPRKYVASRRDVTLSEINIGYFNSHYRVKATRGGFSALAINRIGGLGYGVNQKTPADARAIALQDCQRSTAELDDKPGVPMMAQQIMRSPKWKCRIVHQIGPTGTD
jgi:hypothetical protein